MAGSETSSADAAPIADGSIIQRVVLVDQLERPKPARFEASSLPGHLIHLTTSGRAQLESEGRRYDVAPGVAVWYHENELVQAQVLDPPWVFYTVSFEAPILGPPPFDQRVKPVGNTAVRCFQRLLEAWRDTSAEPAARHMRIHARLLDLLVQLLPRRGQPFRMDPAAQLWWDLEAQIRTDLARPISLGTIQKLTSRSLRSIIRSCHRATGMAPMKRVKLLRMSLARALVLHSDLPFSQIASRVAYTRVQEFSRDYHRYFGLTPTQDRAEGPDYQREQYRIQQRAVPG